VAVDGSGALLMAVGELDEVALGVLDAVVGDGAPVWRVRVAEGVGDGDGVEAGDGDGVEAGAAATVSVVAHGSPAAQRLPRGAAAVVSFVPPSAVAATVAANVAVADGGAPWVPIADKVQVTALSPASSARPLLASSPALLAMLALPSRPDRSSTTVAPAGNGC
jgi:hypothetical protein